MEEQKAFATLPFRGEVPPNLTLPLTRISGGRMLPCWVWAWPAAAAPSAWGSWSCPPGDSVCGPWSGRWADEAATPSWARWMSSPGRCRRPSGTADGHTRSEVTQEHGGSYGPLWGQRHQYDIKFAQESKWGYLNSHRRLGTYITYIRLFVISICHRVPQSCKESWGVKRGHQKLPMSIKGHGAFHVRSTKP